MKSLSDYFDAVLRKRFAYGELDCCTFMADWLVARGFSDPMADRRGSYSTRQEYRAAIRSEGGLLKSCCFRFFDVGLRLYVGVSPGDVALVMAPIGVRRSGRVVSAPTGAIVISDKLRAVVTPDAGLVVAPLPTLLVWGTLEHA